MKKLIALTVSVNYGDILEKLIENNLSIVDEYIIVTTPTDYKTISIAEKYNLTCFQSTSCYHNKAPFNKSKMINIGLKYIYSKYPNDVYLILDADIQLNKNIRNYIDIVEKKYIYGAKRYLIEDINIDLNNINLNDYKLENPIQMYYCCVGFVQLFIDKKFYKEKYRTAAEGDVVFAQSFEKNLLMDDCNVIHLGTIQKNWNGRLDYEKY